MKRLLCGSALGVLGLFLLPTQQAQAAQCQVVYATFISGQDGAHTYTKSRFENDNCQDQESGGIGSAGAGSNAYVQDLRTYNEGQPNEYTVLATRTTQASASQGGLNVFVSGAGVDVETPGGAISGTFPQAYAYAGNTITVDTSQGGDVVEFTAQLCSNASSQASSVIGTTDWNMSIISGSGARLSGKINHTSLGGSCNATQTISITASPVYENGIEIGGKAAIRPYISTYTPVGVVQDANGTHRQSGSISANLKVRVVDVSTNVGCSSTSGGLEGCDVPEVEVAKADNRECGQSTPSPINFAYGFKHKTIVDYSDGALSFVRDYRSDSEWTNDSMGARWRHNFDRGLVISGSEVSIIDGRGAETIFVDNAGSWEPRDSDITTRFEALEDNGVVTGYIYTTNDDTREHYDSTGLLTRIEYRGGEAVDLAYTSGQLTSVSDEYGQSLTLSYSGSNVSGVVTPTGTFTYGYTGSNLTSVTKPDGESMSYHYEDGLYPHALTGITDEKGKRLETYAYDLDGRPTDTEYAGTLETYNVAYNLDGSSTVTNPLGKQTRYEFETIQGLRKITKVEGFQSANCAAANKDYSYNADGFMTSKTDWLGNETTYSYNSEGLVTSMTQGSNTPEARTMTASYDALYRLPDVITDNGLSTDYDYDLHGRVISVKRSDGLDTRETTYSYHADTIDGNGNTVLGRLASVDGARDEFGISDVTSYTYDANNRRIKRTNALGHESEVISFDAADRPLIVEDANNVQTVFVYDALGRVTSSTTAGAVTSYTYDEAGNVLTVTAPNGSTLTYGYNDAQWLTSITDTLNHEIIYTRDVAGNITKREYSAGGASIVYTHNSVFDELSRVMQSVNGDGDITSYEYDVQSNMISTQDGNNQGTIIKTQYAFDGLNRLKNQTDAIGGNTAFGLNALDQVENVNNPKSDITTYTYNAFGDVLTETSPDRGTREYSYDEAGNMVSMEDGRGVVSEYEYDDLNRIIEVKYPIDSSLNQTFTYDATSGCGTGIGRLCSVTDAGGSSAYTYDDLGRVTDVTETRGALSFTTSYGYDASGVLTSITLPSGREITYALNLNGQVLDIDVELDGVSKSVVSGIAYLPFGGIESMTYGNSIALTNLYNAAYQLTSKQHGTLMNESYSYDAAGNITAKGAKVYTFDDLYRLTYEDSDNYSYDAVGNRLSRNSDSYSYEIGSSVLDAINGTSLSTDVAGNVIADTSRNYAIDAAGHVRRVSDEGYDLGTYTYDANNQRTQKVANGVTTHYVHGAGGLLYGEYDDTGVMIREYVYLNGQPIAQIDAPESDTIIDNYSVKPPSATGNWTLSNGSNSYGANSLYSSYAGTSYKWEPELHVGGDYDVYAWWHDYSNRDMTAKYKIHNVNGVDEVSVNQQTHLTDWHPLGTYTLDGDSHVSIAHDGTGVIGADAVRFVSVATGEEFIIDNYNMQPPSSTGNWSISNGAQSYGGHSTNGTYVGTSYQWHTDAHINGLYKVHAWWVEYTNRDMTAVYNVHHVNGVTPVEVNQRDDGGQWNDLGNFTLDENSYVSIAVDGGGVINVDAIRFEPLSASPDEAITFLHTDHLGTPRYGSDGTIGSPTYGQEVWAWDSDAFGNGTPTGSATVNLRFAGQYFDKESDLHYNWNRYYDPDTGRYISSDPIGLDGGLNTFAYVGANPVMFVDPEGLDGGVFSIPLTAAAAAAAASACILTDCINNAVKGLNDIIKVCSGVFDETQEEKDARCDEEWDVAYERCEGYIDDGDTGFTGGHTDVHECAKGLVSQSCKGNDVD